MRAFRTVVAALAAGGALALACTSFDEEPPPPDGNDGGAVDGGGSAPDADTDAGSGCPKGACGIELAKAEDDASEIATDGTRIFWTIDRPAGSVRTLDPATNAPKTISGPEDRPKSPFVFGNIVYYVTGNAVRFVGKNGDNDGGTSATVAAVTAGSGGGNAVSAQRVGNTLFFTAGQRLHRCTTNPNGCGGNPVTVETFSGTNARLLTPGAAGNVWFVNDTDIFLVVANPYARTPLFPVTGVRALAVDETRLFVLRSGSNDVSFIPKDPPPDAGPTTPTALTTEASPPYRLAIDASHVYFTLIETGEVRKVAKSGGASVAIATQLESPKAIAVFGDRILVIANGRILSLPKGD